MAVLDDVLAAKRAEVARLRERPVPPSPLPGRSIAEGYAGWVRQPGAPLQLLCEIKRRSPSAGELSTALEVTDRARRYESAGAAAISVLTDAPFFGGSFDDLAQISAAVRVPTLCKDFILDDAQIAWARASGAAIVLLIVRVVGEALPALLEQAHARGLLALVEVAEESELELALRANALMVGVNARDLDTLKLDPARAARVLDLVPPGVAAIHLSGLRTPASVREVARGRADGALIGEALMRADDPTPLLAALAAAARAPCRR